MENLIKGKGKKVIKEEINNIPIEQVQEFYKTIKWYELRDKISEYLGVEIKIYPLLMKDGSNQVDLGQKFNNWNLAWSSGVFKRIVEGCWIESEWSDIYQEKNGNLAFRVRFSLKYKYMDGNFNSHIFMYAWYTDGNWIFKDYKENII
jgi:hypothetical protein